MEIQPSRLAEVLILTPRRFEDARGFFSEVWNRRTLAGLGIETEFVQDNQSISRGRGVVRGLHFQAPPSAQAKLVRCGQGAVWDVAVDARKGSPTYGEWVGVELSADNGRQVLIPEGFLHGFATLTDTAEVLYKCSAFYDADADGAVRFDSAGLGIDWRLDGADPILSGKDAAAPDFAEFESPFTWEGS